MSQEMSPGVITLLCCWQQWESAGQLADREQDNWPYFWAQSACRGRKITCVFRVLFRRPLNHFSWMSKLL